MRGDPIHPDWLSWWGRRRLRAAARARQRRGGLSEHWTHREPGEFLIYDGLPFEAPWCDRSIPSGGYGRIVHVQPGDTVTDRQGGRWTVTRLQVYTDEVSAGFPVRQMFMNHVRVFAVREQSQDRGLFQINTPARQA
jgi:hypothetical protein